MKLLDKEVFKEIVGYNGIYLVSNYGRVWTNYRKNGKERLLKEIVNSDGYLAVNLYMDGLMKTELIHRLVGLNFIANPQGKPYINHIDGNRTNNTVANLEWCTQKENVSHAINVLGRWSNSETQRRSASRQGKRNRKLDMATARKIRNEYSLGDTSSIKLSKKYGLSKPCILRILNNKSYVEVRDVNE